MSSTQVRLHPITKQLLDSKVEKINKARKKAGKKPITMDDTIYLALEQLTTEMGLAK